MNHRLLEQRELFDQIEQDLLALKKEYQKPDFKSITDETSFYLNEKNNVVIGLNEGDVAPMYMETIEFEIPAEVLRDIRR